MNETVRQLSEEKAPLPRELAERDTEVGRLADAALELTTLRQTRTFRYSMPPRRLYGSARRLAGRGRFDAGWAAARSEERRLAVRVELANAYLKRDFRIHYHVWTLGAFASLLEHCRAALGFPLQVVRLWPNGVEFIAILRRTGPTPER